MVKRRVACSWISAHHHRAAMALKLEYVFPGVGTRRREKERQALIDRLALCVGKACEFGLPGCRKAAEHALRDLACAGTRDAHDADATAAGGGSNSGDRLADIFVAAARWRQTLAK